MRGTIFAHKDPNHKPRFSTVSHQLSDVEIFEVEKELIAGGYEPIPTAKELFGKANKDKKEIIAQVLDLAQKKNQIIGRDTNYYITLEQLEEILNAHT